MEVNCLSADQNTFKLFYLKPGTDEFWESDEIIAGGDADQFRNAVKGYYKSLYGVNPIVTLQFFDETGTETTEDDPNGVHTWKYTIETPMALASATVETIMFVPVDTGATCSMVYPEDDSLA